MFSALEVGLRELPAFRSGIFFSFSFSVSSFIHLRASLGGVLWGFVNSCLYKTSPFSFSSGDQVSVLVVIHLGRRGERAVFNRECA